MNKKTYEWQKEQARVDQVVQEIHDQIDSLQVQVGQITTTIVDIRKNFWSDVTVNLEDQYEFAETYASIKQQAELLSERERMHRHAQNRLRTLKRLEQSPYFGRIDFSEDDSNPFESIYLGISSLRHEETGQFLIYDWRAPICSIYYDFPPGPVHYEAPSGTITGRLERKRQYMIRHGEILSMFDTGITIGDELLQEVLGKQADPQMKSIVSTIQKEQNQIIRNEHSQLIIVQGAAGSGKTSAALQRIAYLLYRYRKSLHAENILLFSPNPLFSTYVSTVLPELGEENMQQTTFQEYLEYYLANSYHVEDPYDQLEYLYSSYTDPGYEARLEGIRFKASTQFLHLMDEYLRTLAKDGIIFNHILFRGKPFITAEQIREYFDSIDSSLTLPNRISLLVEWLHKELKRKTKLEKKSPWVEEEIQLLDREDFLKSYQKLQKKKGYTGEQFNDFQREEDILRTMVIRRRFKPLHRHVEQMQFINYLAIYRALFTNDQLLQILNKEQLPLHWKMICEQTIGKLDQKILSYEDATPFLYLKERMEGFHSNHQIRHVFIDEAQDYSPFQIALICHLFSRSKMTVLGDENQGISAHSSSNLATLVSLFAPEEQEHYHLQQSYRSTQPIVQFTRQLLPQNQGIIPFQREGKMPTISAVVNQHHLIEQIVRRVQQLQEHGHRTIAIICKTTEESREAYAALSAQLTIQHVQKATQAFQQGIVLIPAYLAKGIEFDAVIIYNASRSIYGNAQEEMERKLLYTACTRAMHELYLYYLGEISPYLAEISADTYVKE